MSHSLPRREFLKAGAALTALNILPSTANAASPNSKLRTAHIGVGGMGASDLRSVSSHTNVEVAALCDVDLNMLNKTKEQHGNRNVRLELFNAIQNAFVTVLKFLAPEVMPRIQSPG